MAVAVHQPAADTRLRITLRRSRLLPMLIVATGLICLLSLILTAGQLAPVFGTLTIVAGTFVAVVLLALSTRRALRSPRFDCHAIELLGTARYRLWLVGDSAAHELAIRHWQSVGPLLLLEFDRTPRPLRLLLASDQCERGDWRALRAALNWQRTGV